MMASELSTISSHTRLLSCDKCSDQFIDGRSLDIHLRHVHNDIRPFLCHLCPGRFASPNDLEDHVEICKKSSTGQGHRSAETTPQTEANVIVKNSTKAVTFMCPHCSSRFSSPTKLKVHTLICQKQTHEGNPLEAPSVPTASVTTKDSDTKNKPITIAVNGATVANILGNVKSGKVITKQELDEILSLGKSGDNKFRRGTIRDILHNEKQRTGVDTQVIKLSKSGIANLPSSITGQLRLLSEGQNASKVQNTPNTTTPTTVATTSVVSEASLTPNLPPKVEKIPEQSSDLTPFKCATRDCDKEFASIKKLGEHVNKEHSSDETFSLTCVLCDMSFCGISELEEHVRSFVCPIDAEGKWKGFGSMPSLPSGSLDIFDPSVVGSIGDVKLPDLTELPGLKFDEPERKDASHELLHQKPDPSTFILNDSDSADSEPEDPVIRADQRRQQKQHVCNVCYKTYPTLHSFTRHYRKHTVDGIVPPQAKTETTTTDSKYTCNVCHKSFINFNKLFYHRKIHTGETPFSCRHCDMAYVDTSGLQHHMYSRHPWALNNLKLIRCKVPKGTIGGPRSCPGKFFNVKGLREHYLIVHNNQPGLMAVCEVCHHCFDGAEGMEKHISSNQCSISVKINDWLSHVDVKPGYEPKAQTSVDDAVKVRNSYQTQDKKRSLQVVIQKSTNCPRCRKKFTNLKLLETHYNTRCDAQLKVTDYEWRGGSHVHCYYCTICRLRFNRQTHYDTHMTLHSVAEAPQTSGKTDSVTANPSARSGGKECSLCRKKFDTMVEFFEHYKSHGVPRAKRQKRKQLLDSLTEFLPQDVSLPLTIDSTPQNVDSPLIIEEGASGVVDDSLNNSTEPVVKKPKLIWNASEKSTDASSGPDSDRTLKFRKSCPVCSRVFTTMDAFIAHYRLHYKGDAKPTSMRNASYSCHECGSNFISRQVYLNHMKIHTGETPFKCKFCNEACATECDLGLHIPAAHMKQKFFKIIELGTASRAEKHHLVTSVYELEFLVGVTKQGLKRSNWLGRCLECDTKLHSYKEMKIHILSEECAVTFRPLIVSTSSQQLQRFLCKICGNLYETAPALKAHIIKSHTTILNADKDS